MPPLLRPTDDKPFGFPKPMRGEALLNRRARHAELKKHEESEMRKAKRRDRGCRFPDCDCHKRDLPIDSCHLRHRSMGGNPKGDRTTADQLISLCREKHGWLDAGLIDVQPTTPAGTDGPVDWYRTHPETGRMEVFASEQRVGVSVAVGD